MQDVPIQIQLSSAKGTTTGQAMLRPVSREQAFRKALLGLFGCWGLALVTVPIPIVHFIAPPFLLLLGPVVGYAIHKLYKDAVDIIDGGASCPDCQVSVSLAGRDAHWPLDIVCSACQGRLEARPILLP